MGKSVFVPQGRMMEHTPKNPEKTAYRVVRAALYSASWGNAEIKEFPTKEGLDLALQLQGKTEPSPYHWRRWPSKA